MKLGKSSISFDAWNEDGITLVYNKNIFRCFWRFQSYPGKNPIIVKISKTLRKGVIKSSSVYQGLQIRPGSIQKILTTPPPWVLSNSDRFSLSPVLVLLWRDAWIYLHHHFLLNREEHNNDGPYVVSYHYTTSIPHNASEILRLHSSFVRTSSMRISELEMLDN